MALANPNMAGALPRPSRQSAPAAHRAAHGLRRPQGAAVERRRGRERPRVLPARRAPLCVARRVRRVHRVVPGARDPTAAHARRQVGLQVLLDLRGRDCEALLTPH
eukprot:7290283-Prymnesium_polylepis.2